MITSMTPKERENPDIIDFSRKRRIAKGSGMPIEKVSGMINQFNMMRKMLKNNNLIGKMLVGGANNMPNFDAMPNPGQAIMNTPGQLSQKEQEKRKRLNKLKKKAKQKQRRKK